MYILAPNQTAEIYPYSIGQLRRDNPQTSFPRNPSKELLAQYNVFSVVPNTQPEIDPMAQRIEEATPVLIDGNWLQVWSVIDFTPEEIEQRLQERRESMIVSPRQARLALLSVDKLADVEAAIAALDEPTKSQVTIEWKHATTIERLSPWVVSMTGALGMSEAETDALFDLAESL